MDSPPASTGSGSVHFSHVLLNQGQSQSQTVTQGQSQSADQTDVDGIDANDPSASEARGDVAPCSTLLLQMPHEVLLLIFRFVDVPDLLAVSRTCTSLHTLPCDPVLHLQRLHSIPPRLSYSLSHRPPLSNLKPPRANIYLTSTALAARQVHRELVSARLRRRLGRRPDLSDLVSRNVLPGECVAFIITTAGPRRSGRKSTDGPNAVIFGPVNSPAEHSQYASREMAPFSSHQITIPSSFHASSGCISPQLVHLKRRIERERVKDRIRCWIDGRARQELERRQREEDNEERSVAKLIRRFRTRGQHEGEHVETDDSAAKVKLQKDKLKEGRWGRGAVKWAERRKKEPPRAHVAGLRRFWEGMGRGP